MEDIAQDAETEAKHYISTRGVTNTVPNYDGRRESDDMYDAVKKRVTRSGDVVRMRFGFIDSSTPDYARFQEDGTLGHGQPQGDPDPRKAGTKEPQGNRGIRPMLAIHDAATHAQEELNTRLPRINGRQRKGRTR